MKIIVGLGNYPDKYQSTRHNLGWDWVEWLAKKNQATWSHRSDWQCEVAAITWENQKVLLCKPHTYMNNAGQAVAALRQFYKVELSDWLIISDDLDLPWGQIRWRNKGGAGGHNGLKSIISHLKSQEFSRLRIGIDSPRREQVPTESFVLEKLSSTETSDWEDIAKKGESEILSQWF